MDDDEDAVRDELEALRAIYTDDYEDRSSSLDDLPSFAIQVSPLDVTQRKDIPKITLVVTLPSTYPQTIPSIEFENPYRLSGVDVLKLKENVHNHCEQLLGEVMIHEIVCFIEDFLSEKHKPRRSVYEEMQERIAKEDQLRMISEEKRRKEKNANAELERVEFLSKMEEERRKWQVDGGGESGADGEDDSGEEENNDDDFYPMPPNAADDKERSNSNSRFRSDFIFAELLGRGGGGEVCKVRNRLDRRYYAIKKIVLDADDEERNRKLRREVTTISKMYHKYIVRYYQAWIESSGEDDDGYQGQDEDAEGTQTNTSASYGDRSDDEDADGDDESDFGSLIQWRNPFKESLFLLEADDHDKNGTESEDGATSRKRRDGILTISSSDPSAPSGSSIRSPIESPPGTMHDRRRHKKKKTMMLFIQMEYCQKTLRQVIDTEMLYKRRDDAYRFYREILEALSYIHSLHVIHRDLKPANIFIDVEGRIKVGDFGLATRISDPQEIIISDGVSADVADKRQSAVSISSLESSVATPNNTLTNSNSESHGVGTGLYRSPESLSGRVSDRSDIYAMGIIFYEMVHPPFSTGMERIHVLTKLRGDHHYGDNSGRGETETLWSFLEELSQGSQPSAEPTGTKDEKQFIQEVVDWCLRRSPADRPSADRLLSHSTIISKPKFEPKQIRDVIGSALSSSSSYEKKVIIEELFQRTSSEFIEYLYDMDMVSTVNKTSIQSIRRYLEDLFVFHGACFFTPPLLRPQAATPDKPIMDSVGDDIPLLDRNGNLVGLPSSLLPPFARYVAHKGLLSVKRYIIDRVFHQNEDTPCPEESYEGCFDLITSEPSYMPYLQVELLFIVSQIFFSSRRPAEIQTQHVFRVSNYRMTFGILELCQFPREFIAESHKLFWNRSSLLSASRHRRGGPIPRHAKVSLHKLLGDLEEVQSMKESSNHGNGTNSPKQSPLSDGVPLDYNVAYLEQLQQSIEGIPLVINLHNHPEKSGYRRYRQVYRTVLECIEEMKRMIILCRDITLFVQSQSTSDSPPLDCFLSIQVCLGISDKRGLYRNGLVFEIVRKAPSMKVKSRGHGRGHHAHGLHSDDRLVVVGMGGRYDTLITRQIPPTIQIGTSSIYAVGFSTSLSSLETSFQTTLNAVETTTGRSRNYLHVPFLGSTPSFTVLICSSYGFDEDSLSDRLRVCCLCWKHGLHAEYLPRGQSSHLLFRQSYQSHWSVDMILEKRREHVVVVVIKTHQLVTKQSVRVILNPSSTLLSSKANTSQTVRLQDLPTFLVSTVVQDSLS